MTDSLRSVLVSIGWGAFWGTTLGVWLLAPRLLELHHLAPQTTAHWLVVYVGLALLFSTIGAALNIFASAPVVIWGSARRRKFRHPAWVIGLASPPILVIVHLACCALVEWAAVRGVSVFHVFRPYFGVAAGVIVAWALISIAVYRSLVARQGSRRRLLALCLAAVPVAGLAVLPARIEVPPPAARVDEPELRPTDRAGSSPPILLVSIDGASWRTLEPLLDRGRTPTLASLAKQGLQGEVEALWKPYWSAPAWAAILSGYPQESTGIYEDLAILAPGLPPMQAPLALDPTLNTFLLIEMALARKGVLRLTLPPHDILATTPIWERLSAAGVTSAVIRMPFTFPADTSEAAVVVTDWAGHDQWSLAGLDRRAAPEQLAAPNPRELLDRYSTEKESTARPLTTFVSDPDHPKPAGVKYHPIEMLRFASEIDARSLATTRDILARSPGLDFVAVYLDGLDTVQHAFWQFRFPEEFPEDPPTTEDVAVLGPAIARYLTWLDDELHRLIETFQTPPNVIIVTDHGFKAIQGHPLWKGWHAPRNGVFIASGPSIPSRNHRASVSYFDIVPTVLELAGFTVPSTLPGGSLLPPKEPAAERRAAK